MIKLFIYGFLGYWLYNKTKKSKAVAGYGEAHHPFEHPMGEHVCQVCTHHHPDIEKRLEKVERDHKQF